MMNIIFTFLSAAVVVFLLMLCLTLIRIEKALSIAVMLTERKILKLYGKKS